MLPSQENFLDHDSNSKPFGPFTILDLFVTTTIIAVAVGFQTAIYQQMPGDPASMAFSKTIVGLMGGAFLTIPYWMYRIYRQCGRVLIHPGHFLMVYYAISFVMQIGFICIYVCTSEIQAADLGNVYTAIIAIEGVLLVAACVMALRTRESSEHGWRYFFIGLSFSAFFSAFLYLLGALFMFLGIQPRLGGLFDFFGLQIPGLDMMQVIYYLVLGIYALLFIVCIVFDIRKKRKRDGVHWIGISLAALQGFLIPMLSQIY